MPNNKRQKWSSKRFFRRRGTPPWISVLRWIARQIITWNGPGIFKQAFHWRHHWWYSVRHLSLPRQKHNTSFRIWAQTSNDQTHVILALPLAVRTARLPWLHESGCPSFLSRGEQNTVVHFFQLRVDLTVPLSVCVSPCVCAKNWRSILSLINIQILQLRGVSSCANINMCNCKRIKERQIAHCSVMEATRKPKIEKICWFNWETWDF